MEQTFAIIRGAESSARGLEQKDVTHKGEQTFLILARRCKKYLDADRNGRQIACTVCNLSFTGPSNRLRDAVVHVVKCEDTTAGMTERLLHRLTVMQKGKKYGDAKLVKALEKRGWKFD